MSLLCLDIKVNVQQIEGRKNVQEIMYMDLVLYSKVLHIYVDYVSMPVDLEINRDLMILSLKFDLI